ncbi:MAG: LegC family aminotransferase [Candidatus Methylomirabilales bacterium]
MSRYGFQEPSALIQPGFIPLSIPEIRGNEWKYIKECLDTNWVSSVGPFVDRFERMVANYVGSRFAVATVNGTAALHIALLVAGVQPDEEVLVSTLSFIAPANAIRYIGAWPVFMDADQLYWQMDPERVVDFLQKECQWRNGALYNKHSRRRVRAILPVHILGHPCDMDLIIETARKYNLAVIEDAAESLGAKYQGRMVGHLGDIACFSFNGNKIITTGGGGMIVTDNEEWAARAGYLTTQAKDDPVGYIHNEIGYNYRLTNIQAAIGCAQMEKLDEYIATKHRIARTYAKEFSSVPGITCMPETSWASSIFWIYTVLVDEAAYGMSSRALLKCLEASGIETRPLWQPLHLSPAHPPSHARDCTVAERLARDALSLPSSVGLRPADQRRVIEQVMASATRAQVR